MSLHKLSPQEIQEALPSLPHWHFNEPLNCISREFIWPNFVQAFAFMTQIAELAEQHQHHPEWRNVYNKVVISWTTHDVGGLSHKDLLMAQLCDDLLIDKHA